LQHLFNGIFLRTTWVIPEMEILRLFSPQGQEKWTRFQVLGRGLGIEENVLTFSRPS